MPFAAVTRPRNELAATVHGALGFDLEIANEPEDLATGELIIVGGGNTFQLLRECRNRNLLTQIAGQNSRLQAGEPLFGDMM